MVTITFDVPEEYLGAHISIVSKGQLIGYMKYVRVKQRKANSDIVEVKEYYESLKKKIRSCEGCGDCCNMGTTFSSELWEQIENVVYSQINEKGKPCPMITETGCLLGKYGLQPLGCVISDCSIGYNNCTENFVNISEIQLVERLI